MLGSEKKSMNFQYTRTFLFYKVVKEKYSLVKRSTCADHYLVSMVQSA